MDDIIVKRIGEESLMVVENEGNEDEEIENINEEEQGKEVKVNKIESVLIDLKGKEEEDVIKDEGMKGEDIELMRGLEKKKRWLMKSQGYKGEEGLEIGMNEDEESEMEEKIIEDESVEWIGIEERD